MKFHDELNQKLFSDIELKREVYDKLLEMLDSFTNVTQPFRVDLNAWGYAEIIETDFGNYRNRYGFDIPESLEDSLKIIIYSHMISFIEKNINNWRQ